MRFRLVEANISLGPKWQDAVNTYNSLKDDNEKQKFLKDKLAKLIVKYLRIQDKAQLLIILKSIETWGIDGVKNPVMNLISSAKYAEVPLFKKEYAPNVNKLLRTFFNYKNFHFSSMHKKLMFNISFYNRSQEDFDKISAKMVLLHNSEKTKEAYGRTFDINQLYDENGDLKQTSDILEIVEAFEREAEDSIPQEETLPGGTYNPSNKFIDRYESLKTETEQINFIKNNILPTPPFKKLFGIRTVILDSMMKLGINPDKNLFLEFVLKIPFDIPKAEGFINKFNYIYGSFYNNKLDLDLEVLLNKTLYERSDKDFQYTLNAFNLLSQPSFTKSYFKDTSKVNTKEFMDGNKVKEAGIGSNDPNTIFYKIEEWAKGNEYSTKETIARNTVKKKSDLTRDQLKDIRAKFENQDRKDIQKALEENNKLTKGTIIYCARTDHNDIVGDGRGFYMWDGTKWVEYDTEDAKAVAAPH